MSFGNIFQEADVSGISTFCQVGTIETTHSVPSVGMLPPTPVPSPNSAIQSQAKLGAKADARPKIEVRSNVRLKAVVRP